MRNDTATRSTSHREVADQPWHPESAEDSSPPQPTAPLAPIGAPAAPVRGVVGTAQRPRRSDTHNAIYQRIYRDRQPVAIQTRSGKVLTMVPELRPTPDLVRFTLYHPDGTVARPTVEMSRFGFEQFAKELLLAPAGATLYTPPRLKPVSPLLLAQLAPHWSKRQSEIIATHVASTYPYLQLQHVEPRTRAGSMTTKATKALHYVLVYRDTEANVTLRAHAWRDIEDHVELRVHMLSPVWASCAGMKRLDG